MNTWFSSDFHLSHANIIRFCNRPFSSIVEMDETIISNWNSRVGQYEHAYFLGDFAFCDVEKAQRLLNRLNGVKHLIVGNHDKVAVKLSGWASIRDFAEIRVEGKNITLCHYAMRVWNKSHYGAWHLYGHSHGSLPDDPNSLSFDVGVDCHDFKPLNVSDIGRIMARKTFKPVDHHGST